MRAKYYLPLVSLLLAPAITIAATAQPQDILEPVGTAIQNLEQNGPTELVSANGEVYHFEPLVVSAQLRREMAYRTIRLGLSRPISQRFEDADKLVCRFYRNIRSRVRKHLQCATNRTFHFWAQESIRHLFRGSALSRSSGGLAPYTTYHGPIYNINTVSEGKIRAMVRDVTAEDSLTENETKLFDYARARAVGFARSNQGFENVQVARFANAYRQLRNIDSTSGFSNVSDTHAESIIENAGLDVETYNMIADAAETDKTLAAAILRAADITL